MLSRIWTIVQVAMLLVTITNVDAASADCFGSTAWSTVGTVGLCVTTDRAAWNRVATAPEVVSFDPEGSGFPILVNGATPTSDVTVAVIQEVLLSQIGSADYLEDGELPPTPLDQRLTAGPITEIFQGIPEVAPGSLYVPQFSSVLSILTSPGNGALSLWVEPGVTNTLDYDDPARRFQAWGANFSNVNAGTVAMHAVLGDSDPATAESNVAIAIVAGIEVANGFLGLVTPTGTDLARVRFVVASGPGSNFEIDDVVGSSSIVPEPSVGLLLGLGLIGMAAEARRGPSKDHLRR